MKFLFHFQNLWYQNIFGIQFFWKFMRFVFIESFKDSGKFSLFLSVIVKMFHLFFHTESGELCRQVSMISVIHFIQRINERNLFSHQHCRRCFLWILIRCWVIQSLSFNQQIQRWFLFRWYSWQIALMTSIVLISLFSKNI